MKVTSFAHKVLRVRLPAAQLYLNPTPAALAAWVDKVAPEPVEGTVHADPILAVTGGEGTSDNPPRPILNPASPPKVLIIGGGVAGMMCAIECKRAGIPWLLVEQAEDYGGCWQHSCNADARLQSHKKLYVVDGAAPWQCETDHPDRDTVLEHMNAAADFHGLRDAARFGTRVVAVRRGPGGELEAELRSGGASRAAAAKAEVVEKVEVGGVLVATGKHGRPTRPRVLPGTHVHASKLDGVAMRAKDVTVIGGGSYAV